MRNKWLLLGRLLVGLGLGSRHIAHDCLAAIIYRNLLHHDLLFAAVPVALQGLHLSCESARELVQGSLDAVLLSYRLHMSQSLRERHDGLMYGGHLRGQHDLDLISRFDPFDYGEHKIQECFVNFSPARAAIGQLLKKPGKEVVIRCPNGLHQ